MRNQKPMLLSVASDIGRIRSAGWKYDSGNVGVGGGGSRVREVSRDAVELEGDADVVHAGVLVVDEVLKHDGEHAGSGSARSGGSRPWAVQRMLLGVGSTVVVRRSSAPSSQTAATRSYWSPTMATEESTTRDHGAGTPRAARMRPWRGARRRCCRVGEGVGEHRHDAGWRRRRGTRGRVGGVEVLLHGRITEPEKSSGRTSARPGPPGRTRGSWTYGSFKIRAKRKSRFSGKKLRRPGLPRRAAGPWPPALGRGRSRTRLRRDDRERSRTGEGSGDVRGQKKKRGVQWTIHNPNT
jgi:hypothetical protein